MPARLGGQGKGAVGAHAAGAGAAARLRVQREIMFLAITPFPSFVRDPEGNGVVERFIRTLKEQLLWLETFETMKDLQEALKALRDCFNPQWLLQRHGRHTPAEASDQQTANTLGPCSGGGGNVGVSVISGLDRNHRRRLQPSRRLRHGPRPREWCNGGARAAPSRARLGSSSARPRSG